MKSQTLRGYQNAGGRHGVSPGCVSIRPGFRGCRCARPPATICDPSGMKCQTPRGYQNAGGRHGIPPGCVSIRPGFRGCRCARPPATVCDPSGMGFPTPGYGLSLRDGIRGRFSVGITAAANLLGIKRWLEPGSNQRHANFQSAALPTELSSRLFLSGCAGIKGETGF
jgi:hypothetical protein